MYVYVMMLLPFYLGLLSCLFGALGDKRVHGYGLMLGSGVVIGILWTNAFPSYVAIVPVTLIFISFLFFLLGFGLFLGGLLTRLPEKGGLKRFAILVCLILPTALSLWSAHQRESNRRIQEFAKQEAVAEFQKQTLTAQFGSHTVAFPVSPDLYMRHKCRDHKSICSTSGTSDGLNMVDADDLVLVAIHFDANNRTAALRAAWCQNQTDLAVYGWCDASPPHGFHFIAEDHVRAPLDQSYGATVHTSPEGVDTLACFEQYQGPRCVAVFKVADGIEARVRYLGLPPEEAGRRALQMAPFITMRWRAMQNGT